MRILFVLLAAFTFFSSEQAKAYPNNDVIAPLLGGPGLIFNSSTTASSLGCTIYSAGSCGTLKHCWDAILHGVNTSGEWCCEKYYACRDGESREGQVIEANHVVTTANEQLAPAFENNRNDTFWGYIGTTPRSPNAGRSASAPARLDACIGHGEVDMLGSGSTGWSNCYNKCDSSANGYCTSTGTNNGSSVSAAACKDRCDCVITGFGTCEYL